MCPTILAIDYGEKQVGFAIGHSLNRMIFPLSGNRRTSNRDLVALVSGMVNEYGVDSIVVGYPLHADGTESATCRHIDRFIAILEKRLPLPVERVGEHLTSWEAEETLKTLGKNRRERRTLADAFSAEGILRNYFSKT